MPRIDNIKTNFKKKEYRAWDSNLLDTLKIPKTQLEEDKPVTAQETTTPQEVIKNTSPELVSNQGSNTVQLESNKGSIEVQSVSNQGSNTVQLESNEGSIKVHPTETIRVQLGFNSIEKLIRNLSGNEKKILFYVVDICIEKGSLSTGEIPGKNIISMLGTTRNGMETALKRLRKKGLILREKGKTGRNGLINLSISEAIKNEAIKYIRMNQIEQQSMNKGSIRVQDGRLNRVQLESNGSLYSSSNKNNTTTVLPDEWKRINYTPLESIGFAMQHLLDIFETNLCDPNVVQESIYHFAFGLEEGKYKSYDNPLKVFIGRLRKGSAWFESSYEPPKEKALRELFERKKAEKEKRDALIKEIVDMDFPDWRKKLTEIEISQIVPPDILKTNLTPAITASLRTHYIESVVMPRLRKDQILDNDT
jgi:DNA-binding MarR family transcriptional regulator